MKLSDASEILRLMRDGWELGCDVAGREAAHYWIQSGGLCHGGTSQNVHGATVYSLIRKKLIKVAPRKGDKFWLRRYKIAKLEQEGKP